MKKYAVYLIGFCIIVLFPLSTTAVDTHPLISDMNERLNDTQTVYYFSIGRVNQIIENQDQTIVTLQGISMIIGLQDSPKFKSGEHGYFLYNYTTIGVFNEHIITALLIDQKPIT